MMREVTQTILAEQIDGVVGNCLQAAVASYFDLPIEAVPHFSAFLWWPEALRLWAKGEGFDLKGETTDTIPDRLCIVGGVSPRGFAHVVIGQHGRIVWDPHPSRAGLVSVRDVTWFEPDGSRAWKDGVQAKDPVKHTCTKGLIGSAYGCPACGLGPSGLDAADPRDDGSYWTAHDAPLVVGDDGEAMYWAGYESGVDAQAGLERVSDEGNADGN